MNGFFLVDKESGMTSFDVVRQVRRKFGVKKVGHAGTLDPLATGLLIVALGEGTKLLEFILGCDKEYEVLAKFGFVSDSYDADGSISEFSSKKVEQEEVEGVVSSRFLGKVNQIPPKYSAVKFQGKRAYELARKGQEFELKAKEVNIYQFEVLSYDWPFVSFRVRCGSGTYIRSLIHDLGQALSVGAYVEELRRTSINDFSVKEARKVGALGRGDLITLERCAGKVFPIKNLTSLEYQSLKDGKILRGNVLEQDNMGAFYEGKLVGILENVDEGIKYKKVFHQ